MATSSKPSQSVTQTVTRTDEDEISLDFVEQSVTNALSSIGSSVWGGIEYVLQWLRVHVKNFFKNQLSTLPIVGRWASRIGSTITELCFTVAITTLNFLRVAFGAPALWKHAHEAAMVAWNENEDNGLLAQTYAYAKKMAGYCLEIIKQCFERAIKARGLTVSDSEKQEIDMLLSDLLKGVKTCKSKVEAEEHGS